VVVRAVGSELDIIPGLSEPPAHEDYFQLENPSRRSGLEHTTFFDLCDVNPATIDDVEVVGLFPRLQFKVLLERLAELGGVKPQ
jgi:hypothetical protein